MPAIREGSPSRMVPVRLLAGGPALAAEFDRFRGELEKEIARLSSAPLRMLPLPEVFGAGSSGVFTDARAEFGRMTLVDPTNGDINVLMPVPGNGDVGAFVGVRRGSAANVVTLIAPTGSSFGGLATFTLPSPRRVYLFYYEGRRQGFLPVNDA